MGASTSVNMPYDSQPSQARNIRTEAAPPQGESAFDPQAGYDPQGGSATRQAHLLRYGVDIPLVLAVAALIVIGLLMVFSASWGYAESQKQPVTFMLVSQLKWVTLGVAGAAAATFINYHRYRYLTVVLMLITLVLLVLVLFVQDMRNGAIRSLFEGSVRPSELAKLALVIYLAFWLYSKREVMHKLSFGLFPMIIILGFVGGLLLLQPDLSAVITIFILGGVMFFLAKGDLRQILGVILIAGLVVYLLVTIFPTGQGRLTEYLAGLNRPSDASYHIRRAIGAFVDGGVFGVGIGNGEAKLTGLPVPWTDSIFAVIGEETGLVGVTVVVGLYLVVLWRGLKIASESQDMLGRLLAGGLTFWIVTEAMINMSVMLNLLPSAGNALPLISAGGSSMTMTLVAIGIILNVGRVSHTQKTSEGRTFSAVVDLRRRDGRRRVSSPVRSAGIGK